MKSWTEPAEKIVEYQPWWLKTAHGVKCVEVDSFHFRAQGLVVHIPGTDDRDSAQLLAGTKIAVEKGQLADLGSGDFYWHQLEGLSVISEYQGQHYRLGVVYRLLETGANDVLVVHADADSIDNRERLVPYVPQIYVQNVSLEDKVITVNWDPEF